MNTIGHSFSVDTQAYSVANDNKVSPHAKQNISVFPTTAAEVSQTLANNLADTRETVEEIQKVSDIVLGHKLQFNVNKELGRVVVKVLDPSTNAVIREIPSEELQKIQLQMKHTIGLLFDELV